MMILMKLILILTDLMMTSLMNVMLLMMQVLLKIFLRKGPLDINYILMIILPWIVQVLGFRRNFWKRNCAETFVTEATRTHTG